MELLPSGTDQYTDSSGRTVTALYYDIPVGTDQALFISNFNQTVLALNQAGLGMGSGNQKVIIDAFVDSSNVNDVYAEIDYVAKSDATFAEIALDQSANWSSKIAAYFSGAVTTVSNAGDAIASTVQGFTQAAQNFGSSILNLGPAAIALGIVIVIVVFGKKFLG